MMDDAARTALLARGWTEQQIWAALSGFHFAKEQLSDDERKLLSIGEALLAALNAPRD